MTRVKNEFGRIEDRDVGIGTLEMLGYEWNDDCAHWERIHDIGGDP